ncbi:MAG: hypothetical protein DRI70_05250, partial [Bacteroidetes bacterium]
KRQKKKFEEISVDDIFDRTSKMLDEKIAIKKRLQSILTEEQFEKFHKFIKRKAMERRHEFGRKKP